MTLTDFTELLKAYLTEPSYATIEPIDKGKFKARLPDGSGFIVEISADFDASLTE